MQSTSPGEQILKIPVDGAVWFVCFVEADHELVSVKVFPEAQSGLSHPNVHWDITAGNFDEFPEDVLCLLKTPSMAQSLMFLHSGSS